MTNKKYLAHTSGVGYGFDRFMDEILFFGGDSQSSDEDLPWGKDWVKTTQSPHEPMEVITCRTGDKGLLIETGCYKTFIFKKEKTFTYLKEALIVWSEKGLPTKPLIVAYISKKFCYGINNSKPDVSWSREENKFTSRRIDDSPIPTKRPILNPFLQPNDPTHSVPTDEIAKRRRSPKEQPPGSPGQAI